MQYANYFFIQRLIHIKPLLRINCPLIAGSLNQGAATAYSKPTLRAVHLISIFKIKMAVVSRKHLGNTHRFEASFSDSPLPFFF